MFIFEKLAGKLVYYQRPGPRPPKAHMCRSAAVRHASSRYGVEVCPIIIRQRAVFGHAPGSAVSNAVRQEAESAGQSCGLGRAHWDWLALNKTGQSQSVAGCMAAA